MELGSSLAGFLHLILLLCSATLVASDVHEIDLEHPVITIEPKTLPKVSKCASCERIHLVPHSRYKLNNCATSIGVKVDLSVDIPEQLRHKIQICLHTNASAGLCPCEKGQWKSVRDGTWNSSTSPCQEIFIDVRFFGDVSGPVTVAMEKEFHSWRIIFLAFGVVLLLAAPIVSGWVPFYYSSFMTVGVLLVIIILIFQLMKLLPGGSKNVFRVTIYAPLLGAVAVLVRQFLVLLKSVLMKFGLNEDMYNLVSTFLLVGIVLTGAALGFWFVRKFLIQDDGIVDVGIAEFVSWAIRIIASAFIFQGSCDTLVAWQTMGLSWLICLFITSLKWRLRLSWMICSCITHLKQKKSGYSTSNWCRSPVKGLTSPRRIQRANSDSEKDYYSTLHGMPKQKMSKEEWENWTQQSTREAMAELTSSPEFVEWLIEHGHQIQFHSDDSLDESVDSE